MEIDQEQKKRIAKIRQKIASRVRGWPYDKPICVEVVTVGVAVLEKNVSRDTLTDLEYLILKDYADCCERIADGKQVAQDLRIEDPAKWGAIISKLNGEVQLKQKLLKVLNLVGEPSEYKKKLVKPEGGVDWEGIL